MKFFAGRQVVIL